ncbi:hypothetical protein NA78x_004457 [Anatilimnocola sp. NA78]|uniref:hypothetical protein n=1 Tax=Anatilimnocola sp. NA78 TaxID=3415683 RepID=UPI003CE5396D
MNKAFTREPDTNDVLCPRCDSIGDAVPESAVSHFAPQELRKQLGDTIYFCPAASCPVVYFDAMEATIETTAIAEPVYPKNPAAPLCGCFGFTLEDVQDDVFDTTPRRIRELLARSKSSEARCATAAVSGRCCLPEVQRLYFKLKGAAK